MKIVTILLAVLSIPFLGCNEQAAKASDRGAVAAKAGTGGAQAAAAEPTETDIESVARVTRALQRAAMDAEDARDAFNKTDPAQRNLKAAGEAQAKVLSAIAARIKSTPECWEAALRGAEQKAAREACAKGTAPGGGRLWSFDQRTGVAIVVGAQGAPAP